MEKRWVLYGSYGYTGNLIAEIASKRGANVTLSGRNEDKLRDQAERLGLDYEASDLADTESMDHLLGRHDAVLHCAGPFIHTWQPMAEACLRNRCHYLDITGEIPVFESLKKLDPHFQKKNLMAMPGVGFDVVPSDCLASLLYKKLPDATHLELAISGLGGGLSCGTAKTMIENLGSGGAVRIGGEIEQVPAAYLVRKIRFGDQWRTAVSIPWGDISTAYTSTGIGNIVVYAAVPKKMIQRMKWMNRLGPVVKNNRVKSFLNSQVEKGKPGPTKKEREKGESLVWGTVSNSKGDSVVALLKTMEGYRLTAETSSEIVHRVLSGNFRKGYQTPSLVYGGEFILEFEKSELNYL
ncbi:saccharopine dehydrogenase family protein [Rhodohalobacter halophilus]|uniref:saccharopine dehydrogenase family protein n=1 Tax=Rhodohalobacter halophilus TaxID=1812810 RepID=UPI00083F8DB9|nr:saccharopine dehydrogenase NADP-binding domain-containing protein [Rhodohalobacter halophilus]